MYGYIYKTTDLRNGKIYIGQKRSSKFLGELYFGSGVIIRKIIQKCKKEKIDVTQILTVEMIDTAETKEELDKKEIYWIDALNSTISNLGYNISTGGNGGNLGEVVNQKIS